MLRRFAPSGEWGGVSRSSSSSSMACFFHEGEARARVTWGTAPAPNRHAVVPFCPAARWATSALVAARLQAPRSPAIPVSKPSNPPAVPRQPVSPAHAFLPALGSCAVPRACGHPVLGPPTQHLPISLPPSLSLALQTPTTLTSATTLARSAPMAPPPAPTPAMPPTSSATSSAWTCCALTVSRLLASSLPALLARKGGRGAEETAAHAASFCYVPWPHMLPLLCCYSCDACHASHAEAGLVDESWAYDKASQQCQKCPAGTQRLVYDDPANAECTPW